MEKRYILVTIALIVIFVNIRDVACEDPFHSQLRGTSEIPSGYNSLMRNCEKFKCNQRPQSGDSCTSLTNQHKNKIENFKLKFEQEIDKLLDKNLGRGIENTWGMDSRTDDYLNPATESFIKTEIGVQIDNLKNQLLRKLRKQELEIQKVTDGLKSNVSRLEKQSKQYEETLKLITEKLPVRIDTPKITKKDNLMDIWDQEELKTYDQRIDYSVMATNKYRLKKDITPTEAITDVSIIDGQLWCPVKNRREIMIYTLDGTFQKSIKYIAIDDIFQIKALTSDAYVCKISGDLVIWYVFQLDESKRELRQKSRLPPYNCDISINGNTIYALDQNRGQIHIFEYQSEVFQNIGKVKIPNYHMGHKLDRITYSKNDILTVWSSRLRVAYTFSASTRALITRNRVESSTELLGTDANGNMMFSSPEGLTYIDMGGDANQQEILMQIEGGNLFSTKIESVAINRKDLSMWIMRRYGRSKFSLQKYSAF